VQALEANTIISGAAMGGGGRCERLRRRFRLQ
jgi:hypothetical protein